MKLYMEKDYAAMSRRAALIIAAEIHKNPACVLGLATGSTPIGTYKELIAMNQAGDISFKDVATVNLDEYKGLSGEHDQSYRYFMNDNLFNHVDIDKDFTFVPDGLAEDADAECAAYDEIVEGLGYADLQLLGIGHNGHIGFNEPDSVFTKATHVVDLTDSTIDANTRFFASRDEVPRQALTMGMASIMKARKILLLVTGASKREALKKLMSNEITTAVPATLLQVHPDVTVICDRAAME